MIRDDERSDDNSRIGATRAARMPANGSSIATSISITMMVNGTTHGLTLDPRSTLLDVLREQLDLTGTKKNIMCR